jgi:hypothetical protein
VQAFKKMDARKTSFVDFFTALSKKNLTFKVTP